MRNGNTPLQVIIALVFLLFPPAHDRAIQSQMNSVPADQPSARTDQNSMIAHQELLAKTRQGSIDVYFEGDSITRRWGTSDEQYQKFLKNWRQNFYGWNAADF